MKGYETYTQYHHNSLFDQNSTVEDTKLQQDIHRLEAAINLGTDAATETALDTTLELYKLKVNSLKTEIHRTHHQLSQAQHENKHANQIIKNLEHALDIEQTKTSSALDEVYNLKLALKKSDRAFEKENEKRKQAIQESKSAMQSMKDQLNCLEQQLSKEKKWRRMIMEWLQSELKAAVCWIV